MLFYCISLLVGKYRQKKRDYEILNVGSVVFIHKNMKKFDVFVFFFYICTINIYMSKALIATLFNEKI